jgi:hypothetical protein
MNEQNFQIGDLVKIKTPSYEIRDNPNIYRIDAAFQIDGETQYSLRGRDDKPFPRLKVASEIYRVEVVK